MEKQPTEQADVQEGQDPTDQEQGQSDLDPLEPAIPSSCMLREVSISEFDLIPFIPTDGEEIPDFNTIFHDKEKKRIITRTKKRVDTGGKPGKMVTDKIVVHVTHKDPWLIARAGVALTLANEDNMDRIMTDLEQSWKNVAQLKETLKK